MLIDWLIRQVETAKKTCRQSSWKVDAGNRSHPAMTHRAETRGDLLLSQDSHWHKAARVAWKHSATYIGPCRPSRPKNQESRPRPKRGKAYLMNKLQDGLAYPPRAMRADRAAAYLSVSRSTFLQWVNDGVMPQPTRIGDVVLWDRLALDIAFEQLTETGDDQGRNSFDKVISAIKR
jgi:excisionase family DNA binding protein